MVNQMVNDYPQELDRVFGALSDPTRRAILERLALGETSVTELAAPFPSSLPAISKHLGVLEEAGLIVRESKGRRRICRITPEAMVGAADWIDSTRAFWTKQLDALEAFLASETESEK